MNRTPIPDRIVCGGRRVDVFGQPRGPECGRRFHHWCSHCYAAFPGSDSEEAHARRLAERARAAEWRLGPQREDGSWPATCPTCSQPDPETVAAVKAIERGRAFAEDCIADAMATVDAAIKDAQEGHDS